MNNRQNSLCRRQWLGKTGLGAGALLFFPWRHALGQTGAGDAWALPPIFIDDAPVGDAWRRRLEHPAAAPLVKTLRAAAEERVKDILPGDEVRELLAEPLATINLGDQSVQRYITTGTGSASQFYYLPLLSLAYRLTEQREYAERALAWLDAALSWEAWDAQGVARGDIGASYVVMGSVLAAQWLGPELLGDHRREALQKAWAREGVALSKWNDNIHSNNHPWLSRAGLGLLVATHPECFSDPAGLQTKLIDTFRQSIPLTFSEEGEYNDGLVYAQKTLTATFLFAQALWDRHRIRLIDDARLHAFAEFSLDNTAPDGGDTPSDHEAIPGWNWVMGRPVLSFLAAHYGDEQLAARLRGALADTDRWQRGMKLWYWFDKNSPNPGSVPQSATYVHGVFDLMWMNPAGPASEPFPEEPRYRSYKYTGRSIARNGQFGDATLLWFRAGCANQKDMNDHNGFVWHPAGRRVIDAPRSNLDAWRDDSVNYFKDWQSFFSTSQAANVILVDGLGQQAPDAGGWPAQADREWLHRDGAPRTSRIVAEERLPNGIRWVGEAAKAYPNRLKRWERTVELRDWLDLRVHDVIETVAPDAKIDWLLHTQGQWEERGDKFVVSFEGVRVEAEFRAPANLNVSIEETPLGQGGRRTSYLRASTNADAGLATFDVAMRATVLKS